MSLVANISCQRDEQWELVQYAIQEFNFISFTVTILLPVRRQFTFTYAIQPLEYHFKLWFLRRWNCVVGRTETKTLKYPLIIYMALATRPWQRSVPLFAEHHFNDNIWHFHYLTLMLPCEGVLRYVLQNRISYLIFKYFCSTLLLIFAYIGLKHPFTCSCLSLYQKISK